MARVIIGTVGLIGLWLAAGGAAAQDLQCGDTLGPGGQFTLQADLECTTSPGLTVTDRAVLDLGGHLVSGGAGIAVLVTGRGAVLQNGRTFGEISVQVEGEGGHTVRAIDAPGGTIGILVVSAHNRLDGNTSTSTTVGFLVQGHHNRLVGNEGSGQGGFLVAGDHNVLSQNVAQPFIQFGFEVTGAHNRLEDNEVHSCGEGISVSGTANRIRGNTATDNGTDLVDSHADCDQNQWAQNVFETSRAGDVVNPPCIQ